MKKTEEGKLEIESQIKNIVPQGEMSNGTVVYKAFVGSRIKITIEVDEVFDPTSDTIPTVKERAKKAAISSCERLIKELEGRGYF